MPFINGQWIDEEQARMMAMRGVNPMIYGGTFDAPMIYGGTTDVPDPMLYGGTTDVPGSMAFQGEGMLAQPSFNPLQAFTEPSFTQPLAALNRQATGGFQGEGNAMDPAAINAAMGPQLAGPTVNQFQPTGSDYTPQQLSTPVEQLQQQNIPSNVVPIDPTAGLAATDPNLQGVTPFSTASVASRLQAPGGPSISDIDPAIIAAARAKAQGTSALNPFAALSPISDAHARLPSAGRDIYGDEGGDKGPSLSYPDYPSGGITVTDPSALLDSKQDIIDNASLNLPGSVTGYDKGPGTYYGFQDDPGYPLNDPPIFDAGPFDFNPPSDEEQFGDDDFTQTAAQINAAMSRASGREVDTGSEEFDPTGYEYDGVSYTGEDPGLETVTPLFDALTMGTGLKGAYTIGKVLSKLDRIPSTHSLPGMRFTYNAGTRNVPFGTRPAWRGSTRIDPVTPKSVFTTPAAQVAVNLTPEVDDVVAAAIASATAAPKGALERKSDDAARAAAAQAEKDKQAEIAAANQAANALAAANARTKTAAANRAKVAAAKAASRKAAAARLAARKSAAASRAAASRAVAASAAQASRMRAKAQSVLDKARSTDRGGPSQAEINAAIEVMSQVDTFGGGRLGLGGGGREEGRSSGAAIDSSDQGTGPF